ncbi:MAG: hypothetical protein JW808_11235 [Victivallales bacterium]|nr:hypothetical protein [Victivallales bacterium]
MIEDTNIREAIGKIQSKLRSADTWYVIMRPGQIQIAIMPHYICRDSMEVWLEGFYQLLDFFNTETIQGNIQ